MRRSSWGEQLCPGIVQTRVDVRHDFTSRLQASDGAEIDISKILCCEFGCLSFIVSLTRPALSRHQFEVKTLFRQHARPVLEDDGCSSSDRLQPDDSDVAPCSGVLMPAFEAIMAQKYRFQVRTAIHAVNTSHYLGAVYTGTDLAF